LKENELFAPAYDARVVAAVAEADEIQILAEL